MKKKGFTLIELLAVIVILAVVALVSIPLVTKVIEEVRKNAAVHSALVYIDAVENYMVTSDLNENKYNNLAKNNKYFIIDESSLLDEDADEEINQLFLKDFIKVKGTYPEDGYVIIGDKNIVDSAVFLISGYQITCEDNKNCQAVKMEKVEEKDPINWPEVTCLDNVCSSSSILAIIHDDSLTSGYYTFKVNGKTSDGVEETISYPVHLYVLNGNQVIDEETFYGDENDVSDGASYAKNMVIVKVNGDLTITESGTISPFYNEYGGPKGFTLFVTGKLTNNGTIDNTHGAYAEGENVYLWKNSDDTFEYISALGGNGGAGSTAGSSYSYASGKSGDDSPSSRGTGGGGSGGAKGSSYVSGKSGAGGNGTSYSGGAGSGAGTGGGTSLSASNYGGAGTDAVGSEGGSGAGTPAGSAGTDGHNAVGENGTGGLIVIYSSGFVNNGQINANGKKGGAGLLGGGSSGGGSVNIFTNQKTNITMASTFVDTLYEKIKGQIDVSGGAASKSTNSAARYGGSGGDGTYNIGEIRNGQYYDLKEIIEQDIQSFINKSLKTGDSILSIIKSKNLKDGYYTFSVNGTLDDSTKDEVLYSIHYINLNGDQVIDSDVVFGDENDVSDGKNFAKNMVVVRVKGNLTITENGSIKPYSGTYGGPKGLLLYVDGTLENNGIIENTQGAYAEGENVFLWKNSDESYEYIPALGGNGGAGSTAGSSYSYASGKSGDDSPSSRGTGGGGSGGAKGSSYVSGKSGAGGNGTSYSGGAGSGAGTSGGTSLSASNYGGAGTDAVGSEGGSGAGTPAGSAGTDGHNAVGENGTGGLIIIYSNIFINNGQINANGKKGGAGLLGGGSSGGGSINVFYNELINEGTTNVLGGAASKSSNSAARYGGAGGKGTVTFTKID